MTSPRVLDGLAQPLFLRAAGEWWPVEADWAWTHFWCCVLPEVHFDQLGWWASDVIERGGGA